MVVLRAFRDAGRVSAGSPPSHLQAERSCETGRGRTGGGRGIRASSFHFPFLFGLSARRRAERFGRWGHPEGLLEQADWGGSPGRVFALAAQKPGAGRGRWAGRRGAAGVSGGGLFPRRQRQFRSCRAKKQATKRRTKKDFPSPKRRRFVKTGFSARYKEARRSGRSRGRKSPRPGKGDRRCRLSRFAVRNSGRRCRLSRFAVEKSGRGGRLSRFAVEKSGRGGRLSRFAVRNSQRRGRLWGGPPKGARNLWKPQAGDRRALSRDFPTNSGPGVSSSKT